MSTQFWWSAGFEAGRNARLTHSVAVVVDWFSDVAFDDGHSRVDLLSPHRPTLHSNRSEKMRMASRISGNGEGGSPDRGNGSRLMSHQRVKRCTSSAASVKPGANTGRGFPYFRQHAAGLIWWRSCRLREVCPVPDATMAK